MSFMEKQAADPVCVEPLQAEALRTSFGGEKLYPLLRVGIGDRYIDHPIDGYARVGPTADGE
jgi:hypothetical protein